MPSAMTVRASGQSTWGSPRRSAFSTIQPMSPWRLGARNSRSRSLASSPRAAGAKPTASKPSANAPSRIASLALAASTIRGHPLVGNPDAVRHRPGLVEHVDRDAAARIPVAADAQPSGLQLVLKAFGDADGAGFVESAVIAERGQVQLQRLALDQPVAGDIVDHQMSEVRLAGD